MPFWEHQLIARIMIGGVRLLQAAIGASIGRVQSSVKSQIAYASVAQIGLMFLEVALGFKNFALFHFAGNAFAYVPTFGFSFRSELFDKRAILSFCTQA